MSQIKLKYLILISLLFPCILLGEIADEVAEDLFAQGICVNLREPEYCNGVLKTTQGGVITGPNIRIQGQKIYYTRKMVDGKPVFQAEAEGDLMLELGDYVFVGEKLIYDFQTKTGIVYNGRTALEPWYFGGKEIELCEDGSYRIHHGYVTTSENICPDWTISTEFASLRDNKYLRAKHVNFRILRFPVLWVPTFRANLNYIFDSPFRYYFGWGGAEGPRAGLLYEFFKWERWKAFVRLDYRVRRGFGGGIETYYSSPCHKEEFRTINYFARDSSVYIPSERSRYRFEGVYYNSWQDGTLSLDFSYDKLSDKDMASDYNGNGIELYTGERTQFFLRKQHCAWISSLYARVRLNSFQTVKQELPTFAFFLKPYTIGRTGIVGDSLFRASYLDYEYANNLVDVHDYNSTRLEYQQKFYRPFTHRFITATPSASLVSIYYGNSPENNEQLLALGVLSLDINARLNRTYSRFKHNMQPYAIYTYYTSPTSSPNEHYIFDLDDGWAYVNMLRFGTRHTISFKQCDLPIELLAADIYAFAFFHKENKFRGSIPKIYADATWHTFPTLAFKLTSAWDTEHNLMDHFNFRTEWTVSSDLAIAGEYRQRSPYAWRKVDYDNFVLDFFRTENELFNSSLSDRRRTLLLHVFYRFHPNYALEWESRLGWNRRFEPSYNEFEVNLHARVQSAWKFVLSYQHTEKEDKVAVYASMGFKKPE